MNIQKSVTLASCAAAAVATIAFSSGGIAAQAAKAPPQPFTANVDITEQVTITPAAQCPVSGAVRGTGTGTYLGRLTSGSNDCILPEGATMRFVAANVVLTAANGDRMFGSYAGSLVLATGAISGSYAISSGTGRFSNASGKGQLEGTEDTSPLQQLSATSPGPVTLRGHITLTGTISF